MLLKLLPLYLLIVLGFAAGRFLDVRKETLARLVIYILLPAVVFHAVVRAKLSAAELSLPLIFFGLCCLTAFLSFQLARPRFEPPAPNILAFACGTANSGYFGIPVGMALFGEQALSVIVLCSFGFTLFENTFGVFIVSRGHYTVRESAFRVLRLPAIPAFAAGLLWNWGGLDLSVGVTDLLSNARGAYSVLGMMMIGIALADIRTWRIELRFTLFASIMKFLAWPALVLLLLACGREWFPPHIRAVMFFMSTLPLAANTVAFASLMRTEPEKAAVAVLVTTLLALLLIPLLGPVPALLGLI